MAVTIRACTVEDVKTLQAISYHTFHEAFSPMNTEANMNDYLEKAFQVEKLTRELLHPNSFFYFIYHSDELAGYLKVNVQDAQTEDMGDEALEIERIYIKGTFQKKGLGKALLHQALEIARDAQKKSVWLGVWERNLGAIEFYKNLGFIQTDAHAFYMGDEEQTDYIMVKNMNDHPSANQ